ncbi:ATP-binding cassette, subfamily B, MsbA [Desulfacinum hydrothermale DSM 13146]|uniref:ATP-binding cassette, subfamily B, MsbA n=1 Tax=Desulfacinum hydrothermale DSM 13146 TaxID=1121390 RepID=A0A1W1XWC8_9BACT|nr:lipid A export permease/ATP-binding protein MsbA [Desulfacinum hydrothermale]SMC27818.1 ATP-binding cassette, subfamily B, MsbA [Desulfacinum hydrothermale DSM 13146]
MRFLDPAGQIALRRLIQLIRPHLRRLTLAGGCMLAASATSAVTAYLIKPAMDEIFINKEVAMLKLLPAAFLLVSLLKAISEWGSTYFLQSVGLRAVADLRQQLFNHIHDLPLGFFDKAKTGVLMSRITNDVKEIQMAVTRAVTGMVKDSLTVVGLIFVVFYQNWKLAIIAVAVLPLAFYPLVRFGRRLRKLAKKRQQTVGSLNTVLHESFSGARVVKAFTMEDHEKRRFAEQNRGVLRYQLKTLRINALSSPLMEFIGAIGISAIIGYGGYQVVTGASTPGTFFSFLGALLMLYKPVKSLNKLNSTLQMGIASMIRVYEILDRKTDIVEKPGAAVLERAQGAVEFRDVSFAYDTEPVLKEINLRVRPGEIVALVGSSGGGKTTLVNLIPRFYDVSRGAILVDGIDVRDLNLRSLRNQIAMVTQQSFLFNDTVRNNIAYGAPWKDEEAIVEAAKAAYAYDFIMELPNGFDTVVGEQGVMLSGGQRQRICIARALLKDAPILILDEATSALDSESEQAVQRALENLMRGRTTFVIAHRLSTVQIADRILVISNGRIVEEGPHQALLAQRGEYRRLYDIQIQRG